MRESKESDKKSTSDQGEDTTIMATRNEREIVSESERAEKR